MDAIQMIKRGDLSKAAELCFDCISCGLCSIRCPAEIIHYHVFQLVRRLYGKYIAPKAKHLDIRVKEVIEGKFDEELNKLLKTRDRRLKERYRRLSPDEKNELLKTWHPDYKEGTKRPLKIGPSAGLMVPHEVADLIEAYPLVEPNDIDLSKVDYDVDLLVIGGGGAGTSAAIGLMIVKLYTL